MYLYRPPGSRMSRLELILIICLGLFNQHDQATGQSKEIVVGIGNNITLTCPVAVNELDRAQWADAGTDPDVAIFSGNTGNLFTNLEKYKNFKLLSDDQLTTNNYNLLIQSVELEDESNGYTCTEAGVSLVTYALQVEDPPDNCTISAANMIDGMVTVVEGETVVLSCTCYAAKPSVEPTWTEDLEGTTDISDVTEAVNPDNNYTYDTIRQLEYTANQVDQSKTIKCTGEGHIAEPLIKEMDSVQLNIYFPPGDVSLSCTYPSDATNNSIVECTCSATSNPQSTYSFQRGGTDFCSNRFIVSQGCSEVTCIASNGILPNGESTETICPKPEIATTAKPTPTGKTTGNKGTTVGLIVGVLFALIILIALVVFLVVYLVKRSDQKDEKTNGVGMVTQGQCNVANDNSAYASLIHETITEKTASRSAFSEVPFQNIDLKSILGGKGTIEYWKATLLGSTTGNSVVVKKVSDEASVKLALYHLKELEARQGFSSHGSVAETIGFISSEVSKYILLEFCDNGTLKSFLLDSFDSEKVHKYGNMKKSFQVTAVGSPDKLPKFAQNIVDGMTFLRENKCLHPGLSAKKVLLDSNLVCKLYDFVPEAIVTDRQRILWGKEKMPYKWLAPEMLFLNDYSSAGDVWSLGIVLWEIFSFGMDPHKGKSQVEVEKILRNRGNLQMPTNCPGGMYQVMLDCWNHNAKERPTFHRLREKFLQFSSEGVYVEV